jgi:transcriptional regulator with XRE-family HTH domain
MDMLPKPADAIIAGVGPRLRALRKQHGQTLEKLAAATGISVSTLSRLESARRRPTLDLLLPLAQAHDAPLDILIGAPPVGDPRIYPRPVVSDEVTLVPLSRNTSGLNAVKQVFSPSSASGPHVPQRVHDGYIWLYVITGTLRLTLGEDSLLLSQGDAAEFNTRTPHGFVNPGPAPLELLTIFGSAREHIRMRTGPRS